MCMYISKGVLYESRSPFTMGLYGACSPNNYVIHIALT